MTRPDIHGLPMPAPTPPLPSFVPVRSDRSVAMRSGADGSWTLWQRATDQIEALAIEAANLRAERDALARRGHIDAEAVVRGADRWPDPPPDPEAEHRPLMGQMIVLVAVAVMFLAAGVAIGPVIRSTFGGA